MSKDFKYIFSDSLIYSPFKHIETIFGSNLHNLNDIIKNEFFFISRFETIFRITKSKLTFDTIINIPYVKILSNHLLNIFLIRILTHFIELSEHNKVVYLVK